MSAAGSDQSLAKLLENLQAICHCPDGIRENETMNVVNRTICALAILIVWPFQALAAGEAIRIIEDELIDNIKDIVEQIKNGAEDIEYVRASMEAIKAGQKPEAHNSRWKSLVSDIDDLVKQVKAIEVPANFDQALAIDFAAYRICATRKGEQAKAERFSRALSGEVANADALLISLADATINAEYYRGAVVAVVKLSNELIKVPLLGDYFTWDWFDLSTKVQPAASDLLTAIIEKRKELHTLHQRIARQKENFDGNIQTLDEETCVLTGSYDGKSTHSGTGKQEPFVLTITVKTDTDDDFDYACSM